MGWFTTVAVDEFLAQAGEFLGAEPARNTVILSVTENLRLKVAAGPPPAHPVGRGGAEGDSEHGTVPGHDEPWFGWWRPASYEAAANRTGRNTVAIAIRGAFMHTPGFPVFLTSMGSEAAGELASLLVAAGRQVPGVNAETQAAEAFANAWRHRTGDAVTVHLRTRLFRLDALTRPDPAPEGTSRVAAERDRDLLVEWFGAFSREIDEPAAHDHAAAVGERLSYGGIMIWEARGAPVSIAGMTRAVGGMVRVGPVYTPSALRRRGYAGGVTAAVTQAALDAGATQVVLYTDLANPTSNALYERLGYRPVQDRVVLSFARDDWLARADLPP
jgi:RimJ/RimL family protein N-acetyltransferase